MSANQMSRVRKVCNAKLLSLFLAFIILFLATPVRSLQQAPPDMGNMPGMNSSDMHGTPAGEDPAV